MPVKTILTLTTALMAAAFLHAQHIHVKQPDFASFTAEKRIASETLERISSDEAKRHAEYGIVPFNSQCSNCEEVIDKRTIDSRFFIEPGNANHTYSQKSYFPLHYKSNDGTLRTIDYRLHPDSKQSGVFVADKQPVPTKCDLNKKTTSITGENFEFEFNKELQLYFFDGNGISTTPQIGNYSNHTIGDDGIAVKEMWSGIDMQQQFKTGEIKTSYRINAPLHLPVSSGYMVIEDHFTLPEGFSFVESSPALHTDDNYYQGDYELKDREGKTLIVYEKPVYLDATSRGMHGRYQLKKSGNDYALQMLIPVNWLSAVDNVYPVIIDPLVASGVTKIGDFSSVGLSANLAFSTLPASCNYHMNVAVPGQSTLTKVYCDVEYQLTYNPSCGNPPLPAPFCTASQIFQKLVCDQCNVSVNLFCVQDTGLSAALCTTDSNRLPNAHRIQVTGIQPNFVSCYAPQCPIYMIPFTLQNSDSTCGDVCGYLCARGNMWQMTVEANIDTNAGLVSLTLNHDTLFAPPGYIRYVWNGSAVDTQRFYVVTQNGTYRVALTDSSNSCYFSAYYDITTFTGINEAESATPEISVYPNPGYQSVTVNTYNFAAALFSVYNAEGQKLLESKEKKLDISFLPRGVFYLKAENNKKSVWVKLVKM